jgi:hypothetical protein
MDYAEGRQQLAHFREQIGSIRAQMRAAQAGMQPEPVRTPSSRPLPPPGGYPPSSVGTAICS